MRRIVLCTVLVFSLVLLFQNFAQGGQFFGALEPITKKGEFSVGVGYFYSADNFRQENAINQVDVSLDSFRFALPISIPKFNVKAKQNQYFIQGSYGFIDGGEVYLRGGFADIKFDRVFVKEDFNLSDFDDDPKIFGTLGVRLRNDLNSIFSVGMFLQGTVYSTYEDTESVNFPGLRIKEKVEVKNAPWEINLGVGLQAKLYADNTTKVILYGGPMVYWEQFDVKESAEVDIDPAIYPLGFTFLTAEASTSYKEKNNLGGFLGLRLSLAKQFHIEVEAQKKSRISVGGALTYSF